MNNRDRELGMGRSITRRDFLNGSAISIGSLTAHSQLLGFPNGIQQDGAAYYPPALRGMRGSHEGSFETMHALRDGKALTSFGQAVETNETYDLIVVGAGISGLSAAFFYRAQAGPGTRILILDNHDDFGGHAKRNEFRTSGRFLLANGGTYAIESPTAYSQQARRLMDQLGIRPAALEKKCARMPYQKLGAGFFFDKETFGADKLVIDLPETDSEAKSRPSTATWKRFLSRAPLPASARQDITRLEEDAIDYLPELTQTEKKRHLAKMSYGAFLAQYVKVGREAIAFYQTRTHDLYGVGIDAVNALDCWAYEFPGFGGMSLERVPTPGLGFTARGEVTGREPYFFHYPDGNASIARLLVRALIPNSITGHTAEDIVMAKADYSALDRPSSAVRIRLNSTAVRVKHSGPVGARSDVDVEYVRNKALYRIRAKSVVMACWNMVIPYLCPELPQEQKTALAYGAKVPLVYTVVALRNWRCFEKVGIWRIEAPGMYHSEMHLDDAIDIAGYQSPRTSDQPILLRLLRTPCKIGLSEREQHRVGRYDLLTTTFEMFERQIRDQLARTLETGGFDPAVDIKGITVNRWPHGYAYEYNSLFDPDWPVGQRPCDVARRQFGRITIANSDAAAAAYTDQAIDQAYRAVEELLAL